MNFSKTTNQTILEALTEQFDYFHHGLAKRDVASKQLDAVKRDLSSDSASFEQLHQYILNDIQPNLSASNGGRYWGFVTGGANPVATYADWLVTTFNQNVSKGGDSMASDIERQTLKWVCQLFDLPETFNGVFTTGATAANLLGAFTARQFIGKKQGIDVAADGMKDVDFAIYSATPHASMQKSFAMAGLGRNNWHKVACLPQSEAMDVKALAIALQNNSSRNNIVVASAGTVTGTDYDDLDVISKLCKKYGAWLHVDAAFGIFERLVAGATGKTKGIELADSITLDCHKWLNVPYDCGVFLTQHQQLLRETCEVDAPYLIGGNGEVAFMGLGIENSRRFRAFPVWATLFVYGKDGIKLQIQRNMQQAQKVADWIAQSENFDLVKSCDLNVVLFQPNSKNLLMDSNECMAQLNSTGNVFLSPGIWQEQPIIRAALSNWSTTDEDVNKVIAALSAISV